MKLRPFTRAGNYVKIVAQIRTVDRMGGTRISPTPQQNKNNLGATRLFHSFDLTLCEVIQEIATSE